MGVNGVGKTTLLEIINKNIDYDSGELFYDKNTVIKYIPQLGEPRRKTISGKYASIFQVENNWNNNMSGGEKTRFKLAEGFENSNTEILRQYFINHPQSIDKYTFLQNSAFTHWVKEKCSKMC